MNLGNATVYRWIQRFVPQISEYVNSLSPELSETWHADELFVKMKGGQRTTVEAMGTMNMACLWNVMDRETRCLLASRLSRCRDVAGADRALRGAMSHARGDGPRRYLLTRSAPTERQFPCCLWTEAKPCREGGNREASRDERQNREAQRHTTRESEGSEGMEVHADPACRRTEDSSRLREASPSIGRSDSRTGHGGRGRGQEQVISDAHGGRRPRARVIQSK